MKHLFFLQNPLSLVVGSRSARSWLDNGSFTAGKFLATLLLFLTLGVGNMWGAPVNEQVYKQTIFNSTNNSQGISSYSNSWSNTTNSFTINITNANNSNNAWSYIKMGSKNAASTGTLITNAVIDKKVTKVELNIDAITSKNVTSIKLYSSTNKSTWTERGSFDKSTGAKTVTIADATQTANWYYKVEVVCPKSSNGVITISGLKFYYDAGYSITYNCDGADSGCPSNLTGQTKLPNPLPAAPVKDGFDFDGWYTNSAKTTAASAGASLTGNTTLYAKWVASASCANSITITKGTPSHGSFDISGDGDICIDGGNASVTISNIQPESGYRFKEITSSGGGTINNNAKTVTNISANTTINVEFETIPSHKAYFYNGTTLLNTGGTSFQEGAAVSYSGATPTSCESGTNASTTFAGWATDTWSGKVAKNEIEPDFYEGTLPVMGENDVTYHAVFCKGGNHTVTITNADFTGSDLTNSYTTITITKTIGTTDYDFEINACKQNSMCQLRDNATLSYIEIPELPGVIKSIATTECSNAASPASNYSGTLHLKSSKTRGNSDTDDIAKIALSNASSFNWDLSSNTTHSSGWLFTSAGLRIKDLTITYGTETSNYMTTCCQPLGSINGSVSLDQLDTPDPKRLKATWSWGDNPDMTGIAHSVIKIYNASTDALVHTSGNIANNVTTYEVPANTLTPCTAYYATITTVKDNNVANACEGVEQGKSETNVSTIGYTYGVTKTNVSLKTGEAEEGSTCDGDFSAQYVAAAGYALPATLTVSGASSHTWSNGTLTIDDANVTGNVSTTIAGTCVKPIVKTDPVSATYPQAAGTGTALFIVEEVATAAGATLSYQWQSKVGEADWADIEGATNATYAPSKANVGITLYRVKVTSNCGEYAFSGAATIEISSIPVCETPTFSPEAGTYNANQTITISSETNGSTIYYTIGSNPDDPTTSDTEYDPENKPVVSATNTTIKAIAVKDGCTNSAVGSATYVLKCLAPTFTPGEGAVVNGQEIALSCATAGASIYYSTDGNTPTIDAQHLYDANHKPVVSAATTIKAIAVKDGWTNSDEASAAYTAKYTVTLNIGGGKDIGSATGWGNPSTGVYTQTQTTSDASITLPDATLSSGLETAGWSFAGWKLGSAVGEETTEEQSFVATSYTPTSDVTLYAVYKINSGDEPDYELVEADLVTAWAGDYLIARSNTIFADGRTAGTDGIGKQSSSVNPSTNLNGKVIAASWGDTYNVTLEEISENSNTYVLKTKDGKYNYHTTNGSNGLSNTENKSTAAAYPITVTFTSSSDIRLGLGGDATGAVFRWNDAVIGSGGQVFRFYKNCGQSAVYLYKKGAPAVSYFSNPSSTVTLTYDANEATAGSAPAAANYTIGGTATVVAQPEGLVKTGYTFAGWNTKADGTGTNYVNGTAQQSFDIYKNTTLYAKWTKNNYTVAVASVDHTTITATPADASAITEGNSNTEVAYGTVVTLGKTDDTHFTFDEWDVYQTNNSSNKVTVTETAGVYTFTVPDFNVTVSATAPVEDEKVTVTWHMNYNTSTSANVYVNTPFSQLTAPAVADNAVPTCANKFMGWATAAINTDNATSSNVQWANETNVSSTNKDFYAVWATEDAANTFNILGDANDFVSGADYIIASYDGENDWKLKAENYNSTAYQQVATQTSIGANYEETDGNYIWTITNEGENSVSIYNATTEKYLAIIVSGTHTNLVLQGDKATLTKSVTEGTGNNADHFEFGGNSKYVNFYDKNNPYYNAYNQDGALYLYLRDVAYSNYITNCCLPVENALTITNANEVATGEDLTLTSTGGNGGTVAWSVVAGTGTATISEGVLTGGNLGTVTLKAHQNANGNYCAQDAEDMTVTIVSATIAVTGVTVSPATAALLPGETVQLAATVAPNDASNKTIKSWVSSSDAATVNAGLVTAVAKGTSTVTVTTTDGEFTDNCAVTVHGLTIEMKDETGATISAEGVTASADGRDLTASATVASKYVFYQWEMVTASGMSIPVGDEGNADITLSGTPTGDVTIKAIFYKPVTITWLVDGEDAAAGSQTLSVARGTLWSALTPAAEPAGNALGSCATAFVGWSNLNSELRGNGNPAPAVLFRNSQISSYNTEITDPITFRAVFATSAQGATFDGSAGDYKIYALVGETKYYAQGTGSKIESTTDASLATTYTFEAVDGGFAIKTGGYYITYSSSTNLGTSDKAYTWTVGSGVKGTKRLTSETSGRGWIYRAGTTNQFGGYATSNVTAAGTEYYDLEIGSDASYTNYVTVCCTPHNISIINNDESENKTVSADAEAICDGMTVNLSHSTSCTHYTFHEWVVKYTDGDEVEHTINVPEATGSFTMPAYNVTVEGDWSPVNYKVTINNTDANGTATVKEGYDTDDQGRWLVPYGSTVTLQATPNDAEAYYFSGWTLSPDMDVQKSQAVLPITMTGSFTATPSFAQIVESALTLGSAEGVYSLSATLANGDPIPDATQIKSGTALKVTYALSGQNEYVGWTFSVNSVEKTAEGTTVTFNMPEEDLNVSLNTRPYYMLNLSAEHGSITGVSIAGEAQELASQYIVHQNELVALTAAPEDNTYKFKEWTGATVTNNQFTVGTEDLNVKAVFELKDTYTLTLMALGREQEKIEGILEGESIWEQIDDKEAPEITGQLFLGWSLIADDESMIISENDDMPIGEGYTTLYAVYQAMTPCYVKVTSTSDIKNGKYLIVYETGGLAFNGGLETLDAASNRIIGVEINTVGDYKTIEISNATTAAEFTIASLDGGGYSIKSASGKYIGRGGDSNGLNEDTETVYTNTLSINNDGNFVCVGSGGAYMRYNSTSGQDRFRYFKSSTYSDQKAIQLYKRAGIPNAQGETASIPTLNVTTVVDADDIFPDGKAGNIIVENGGKLTIGSDLTVNDFTIESQAGSSGQLLGGSNVTVNGNIYMDVKFYSEDALDATSADQWYMISAPFAVDLNGGFLQTNGTPMVFGQDFDLFFYDGQKRANTGTTGWTRVQGQMPAGRACLIGFNADQSTTIRLKAASKVISDPTSIGLSEFTEAVDAEGANSNWNGVANPTFHYTDLNKDAYVWNNEEDNGENQGRKYTVYTAGSCTFVVGTPFFIQDNTSASLTTATNSQFRAPKRNADERIEYCVRISREGANGFADQMYVRASEEATNTYEQGHDMITWNGTSGKSALLWSENYGMRLAIEEAPMVNNMASYALGIFAPAAGKYTISVPTDNEDATLYLTQNGHIIWNLTAGAYEAELQKGTTNEYGLKMVAAPKMPTGIENEPTSDSLKGRVSKVVIDNNVFILRNGQMFDVTGKMAK